MDSAQRETLAERIVSRSTADQTEVCAIWSTSDLTRVAKELVPQNVAQAGTSIRIRAIVEGRTGVATTSVAEESACAAALERAIVMARLSQKDPERGELPGAAEYVTPQDAYAQATAQASPAVRAEMASEIFSVANDFGYWPAGFAATSAAGITVVNSCGARASFEGTDAAVNVKMNGPDSTGYGEGYDNDVARIDARAAAGVAAEKTRATAAPQSVDPGDWTVILEPVAFGELLAYLADHFSAQNYDEGSSFMSDGLDKQYLGGNVSISDDFGHPLAPGMPFDFEGQPTKRLSLIENGVARNVVTDSYWARKLGMENTGHALPAPNPYGPQATHLVVHPGSKPVAELIAQTGKGLLVSRFWYIRTVDQRKGMVTGMTRDGTFLIEDGRLRGGVRNLRFNVSIIEALRNCEFSSALQRTGSYHYSIVVPAAKISAFTFSSAAAF